MRISLFILLVVFSINVFSQASKIQEQADNKVKQIEADLNVAKAKIDKDILDPILSQEAMTWYLKGYIYTEMAKSKVHRSKYARIPEQALEALQKCIEIDVRKDLFPKVVNVFFNLSPTFYNDGIAFYNKALKSGINEEFQNALTNFQNFEKCLDLLGYDDKIIKHLLEYSNINTYSINLYAGYSAEMIGKFEEAKKFYNNVILLDKSNEEAKKIGIPLAYIYMTKLLQREKDEKQAKIIIDKAMELWPDNGDIINTAVAFYKDINDNEQLAKSLELICEKNPKDIQSLSILANTYKNMEKDYTSNGYESTAKEFREKAVATYKRALACNSTDNKLNFTLNYNAGLMYYNPAVALYQNKADLQKEEYTNLFTEASILFEEAHKANPKDKNVINILINIYKVLHLTDKGLAMETKLQKL